MDCSSTRSESPLTDIEFSVQLWLKLEAGGEWVPVLSIPEDDFGQYTLRPLKWLRFLGYAICGREGRLCVNTDGLEVDDYMAETLEENYYYSYSGYVDSLAPVDVDGFGGRESDEYTHSHSSQADFKDELIARDGSCVLTNLQPLLCDAVHLLPFTKGNQYIERVTRMRSSERDIIEDISDIKNGLLIAKSLHPLLRQPDMGLLKTPNFALNVDDVPPSPRPVSTQASGRLTVQYFVEQDRPLLSLLPFNQDVRPSNDSTHWPPSTTITDFLYACAVMKKWGNNEAIKTLRCMTAHYNEGGDSESRQEDKQRRKERADRSRRWDKEHVRLPGGGRTTTGRGKNDAVHAQAPHAEEIMDWILTLSSIHMSRPKGTRRGSQSSRGLDEERKQSVQEWLNSQ